MFQDVLLVPAGPGFAEPTAPPATSVSFSCVLSQIEQVAESCRAIAPDSVEGPRDTYWNTRDIEVITPERTRVIFTAAKQYDGTSEATLEQDLGAAIDMDVPPGSPEANELAERHREVFGNFFPITHQMQVCRSASDGCSRQTRASWPTTTASETVWRATWR